MTRVRLQKAIAQAGHASRRKAEELILAGRVRVNGVIVRELGVQVDPRRDRIELDGRRVVPQKPVYYLVHKPRGMITTMTDPEGRPTIQDVLKKIPERVFPVGRLDFHTSGVILATNDGEMAEALSHPRSRVKKVYIAKFTGYLNDEELAMLRNGVTLDDGYVTRPADVYVDRVERDVTWLRIGITEGKNRQIHRMAEAIGKKVFRLARLEYAGLTAEGLKPGEFRPLFTKEIDALKKSYFNPHRRWKANRRAEERRALLEGAPIDEHFEFGGDLDEEDAAAFEETFGRGGAEFEPREDWGDAERSARPSARGRRGGHAEEEGQVGAEGGRGRRGRGGARAIEGSEGGRGRRARADRFAERGDRKKSPDGGRTDLRKPPHRDEAQKKKRR